MCDSDTSFQLSGQGGVCWPQRVVLDVMASGTVAAIQNTYGKLRRFAF
ncbi:MAG: hypothetical protein KJ999_23770 [Gammaproteobacteria bacterium]|nr:hypothetical protein [Gammaproteobacteria bacterium]MBU2123431.1 hypothetical protein [Gammaproteobacteria bacterium]MBU2201465.1 hypothetical protein [Gammaproteobacteria bacterium]